jgi:DNA polymerase I
MQIEHPATAEAYQLLHDGALAFSAIEAAGMRVDVPYLDRTIVETEQRIASIEARLKEMDEYKLQRRRFGTDTNLTSRDQLATVLFQDMGLPCEKKTKTGRPQLDEEALLKTGLNYCKGLLKLEKLNKLNGTYLHGLRREVEDDGYVHGSFNLASGAHSDDDRGGARSYRSSMSDPNLQNVPIRNKEIGKLIRTAFIPSSDDHVLVEIDFSGHEVRVACNLSKDPKLIYDTLHGDMHRDMAAECFLLEQDQVTKPIRGAAKGGFVFAEFYGDWYKQVARNLWGEIGLQTVSGTMLEDHLNFLGIAELGDCDPKAKSVKGTFEDHIRQVEDRFWNERFHVYRDWRTMRVKQYKSRGWFDLPTGFVCSGVYSKNQVLNYPIQGAAFHCLLWVLIQAVKEMRRRKMRSRIVGQIHDSAVADVHRAELDDYVELITRLATVEIQKAWKWITVPLAVDVDMAEDCWFNKKKYEKKAVDLVACVACGGTGRNSKGGLCVPCQRKKGTAKCV